MFGFALLLFSFMKDKFNKELGQQIEVDRFAAGTDDANAFHIVLLSLNSMLHERNTVKSNVDRPVATYPRLPNSSE